MKFTRYILGAILSVFAVSCTDYLDKTPLSDLSEKDIFTKFETFQGFTDQIYLYLLEPITQGVSSPVCFGDEGHTSSTVQPTYYANNGDYWNLLSGGSGGYSLFDRSTGANASQIGFWGGSWSAIRLANQSIENLPRLIESGTATQEQIDLIKGQNLFLRAYYHYTIMSYFGGVPYMDHVPTPTENIKFSRPTLVEGMSKSVDDYLVAADLLPKNWDETNVGKVTPTKNEGRPTKGTAFGMAAKALLFMGSPLNTADHQYNSMVCKKSAMYGWEVIKLAQEGYHTLLPIDDPNNDPNNTYKSNFILPDFSKNSPYTKENLLTTTMDKTYLLNNTNPFKYLADSYFPVSAGGATKAVVATQNIVDLFETANGLMPEDDNSYSATSPWVNRDPRFYQSIMTDGTVYSGNGYKLQSFAYNATAKAGRDFGSGQTETGYYIKKYWIYECLTGGLRVNVGVSTPRLRLAEVYLNYAEALIAAGFGPNDKPVFDNGKTGISAYEAVDAVRARIYKPTGQRILPPVDMNKYGAPGKDGSVKGTFMEKIWNERAVELCFEMNRWFDLRRWYVATQSKYKDLYGCRFNEDHTEFAKVKIGTINFEPKHYWLPIPLKDMYLYDDYKQNPGW